MFDLDSLNNKIIIIKDSMKASLLELINKENKLFNIKIITLSELKNKYLFEYDKRAIYYICNKYNVIGDIAKIYLDNLYYINDVVENDKLKFLYDLKNELIENNLLEFNSLFRSFLKNKDIVLFDLKYVDDFYKNIFKDLEKNNKVEEINYEVDNGIKSIYSCNNPEEEIVFVASEICKLIKSGVDINRIKLANVNSDYHYIINKIFKMFNINVELKSNSLIKGNNIVKTFKKYFDSNIENTFNELDKIIVSEQDKKIYKKLINIVNEYSFIDDKELVKDLIFNDIDKIKTENVLYENAVRVVNIEDEIISDDDYVFLINFNEGVIPINHKDEEYLNDKTRLLLGISTSYDLNEKASSSIKNAILRVNNLYITYSTHNMNSEIYVSSSYDESILKSMPVKIDYDNSNKYNKIKLLSELDLNKKFGVVSEDLITLNSHYKDYEYLSYSNDYKLIDKNSLLDYLRRGLTLSYTSVNSYYECSFKYYLDYILRINKYEDSFEIVLGNIFHKILSECFVDDYDFDKSWNRETNNSKYDFNNMEKFFLNNLKEELLLIINTIKNQMNYISLKKSMYEKEIVIPINNELKIIFKGFVDKVLYDEINGEVIAVIIDYKTGNPKLNINNVIYGLNMQLPIYIYLIKNSDFKNVRIGGFYLQKILNNKKNKEERIDSLKLQGYSNSDESVLRYVDSSYMNSKIIKSLRVGNNGFYSYSKIISDKNIDKLNEIVSNNINKASDDIANCHFDINPKEINNVNLSCTYCKYKDICYMKNENIVKLNQVTNLFGGEDDD